MISPTPSKPTIRVVPSTEEDIEQLSYWTHNVLERGDSVMDAVFAHPELAFKDGEVTRELFTAPSRMTFIAVVVGGGEGGGDCKVGFVTAWLAADNWVEEEAKEAAHNTDSPPWHRADPEMLSQFFGRIADSRREVLGGKAHLFVQLVCVDRPYQRLGAGRKLMEHLLQIAREANVPTYLDATYAGSQLYKRIGFEVVKISKLETADGRAIEFPSMVKYVEPITTHC